MNIMQISKSFLLLVFTVFLAIGFASCNSGADDKQESHTISPEQEAELSQLDTISITISANDRMQFDKDVLVAYAGQVVELTLAHTGTMPVVSMGHNFVLIDNEISVARYARLAMKAKNRDYIPEDSELTLAHTRMIGGGESETITFKAPPVGEYDFLCSFPGHYSIMKGKFIVK